jgi:hypothetical protein
MLDDHANTDAVYVMKGGGREQRRGGVHKPVAVSDTMARQLCNGGAQRG